VDGLWPYLLFLFLAAWFEAAPVRKWLNLAALALPALLIPACWHKFQIPEHALDPWGRGEPQLFSGLLFLLLPIGTVVLALLPQPRPPAEDLAPRPRHPQGARVRVSRARPQSPAWMKPALTLGSLLIGGALVWGVLDRAKKNLGQIEYYAAIKEPERVLALVSRLKTVTPEAEIRAQLALYHTGRLTQDLFVFANRGSGVLLPGTQLGLLACRSQIQTLLELGHVNEAEHQAAEAIESEGDRPDLLRALAHIYVLKDHPKAAAVFLNRLRQVPFQGDAAARWLAELEQNPRFTEDHDLDLVRSRMPTTDLPHGAMAAEVMLNQLLHTNPRNQMAFEYLMAQYLLDGDFKRLAQHAGQLDDFSYLAIPRHIEEALLLGQKLQGVEFDLHGRKIRPDTLRRFQGFCDALSGSAAQAPVALFALVPDFGDTFWYYYYLRLARRQASPG